MIPHSEFGDNADDDIFSPPKLRKVNREGGDGAATKVALNTDEKEEKKATHVTGTIKNDENVSDDYDDDNDDDDDETGTINNDENHLDDDDDDDNDDEDEVIEDFFAQCYGCTVPCNTNVL